MEALASWLADNALGLAMAETSWAIPLIQSVHIIAIATVMGAALVVNLRVAGLLSREAAFPAVERRFMPTIWWSLLVLLVTGFLLILTEPDRALLNQIFHLKMVLLVLVVVITSVVQGVLRGARTSSSSLGFPLTALAFIALGLWSVIILCGRWIGYS